MGIKTEDRGERDWWKMSLASLIPRRDGMAAWRRHVRWRHAANIAGMETTGNEEVVSGRRAFLTLWSRSYSAWRPAIAREGGRLPYGRKETASRTMKGKYASGCGAGG